MPRHLPIGEEQVEYPEGMDPRTSSSHAKAPSFEPAEPEAPWYERALDSFTDPFKDAYRHPEAAVRGVLRGVPPARWALQGLEAFDSGPNESFKEGLDKYIPGLRPAIAHGREAVTADLDDLAQRYYNKGYSIPGGTMAAISSGQELAADNFDPTDLMNLAFMAIPGGHAAVRKGLQVSRGLKEAKALDRTIEDLKAGIAYQKDPAYRQQLQQQLLEKLAERGR